MPKLHVGEPLEDVVQRITLIKAVDKNCLLDAMEHFYHFKMVKENDKE